MPRVRPPPPPCPTPAAQAAAAAAAFAQAALAPAGEELPAQPPQVAGGRWGHRASGPRAAPAGVGAGTFAQAALAPAGEELPAQPPPPSGTPPAGVGAGTFAQAALAPAGATFGAFLRGGEALVPWDEWKHMGLCSPDQGHPAEFGRFPDTQRGQLQALNVLVKYLRWRCTTADGALAEWVPPQGFSLSREVFIPTWVPSVNDKRYGTWDTDPSKQMLVEWPHVWRYVWKLMPRANDYALAPAGEAWLEGIGPDAPDAPTNCLVRPVPTIPSPHETIKGCHWEVNFTYTAASRLTPVIPHGIIGVIRGGPTHHPGQNPPGPGLAARPRPDPAPPLGALPLAT